MARISLGTQTHYRWLTGIIGALLILNLFDAIFTLLWINAGVAQESNMLLRDLVSERPVLFVVVKLALVSLGSLLLWQARRRPLAVIAIFAAFLLYYFILIYHLQYAAALLQMWLRG